MKWLIAALLIISAQGAKMAPIYTFTLNDIEGNAVPLAQYSGKVMLIVNVASKCGYTPQYEGLQALYDKHKGSGLVILGFPCNQFAHQEPGSPQEIQNFCRLNYGVSFPIFEKIEVNGDNAHPLYQYLKSEQPGILGTEAIKWNFTKFLIDRHGNVLKRYGSATKPADIEDDILKALKAS